MAQASKAPQAQDGMAWIRAGEVEPWAHNPRWNDDAIEPVAMSIHRFGFVTPLVVWSSKSRLVAGHTRLKALAFLQANRPTFDEDGEHLGWEPRPEDDPYHVVAGFHENGDPVLAPEPDAVPVRWTEFQDEKAADAYALADNRLNELAQWDEDGLREVLDGLDAEIRGDLGWEDSELEALLNPASLDDINWKTFDGTVGDGASGGKQVKCPECGHQFKV